MACLALAAYASLVGDWMFGSRFFVPVLPMAAIVTASALSLLSQWSWRLAVLATATSIAWSAFSGVAFLRSYT